MDGEGEGGNDDCNDAIADVKMPAAEEGEDYRDVYKLWSCMRYYICRDPSR